MNALARRRRDLPREIIFDLLDLLSGFEHSYRWCSEEISELLGRMPNILNVWSIEWHVMKLENAINISFMISLVVFVPIKSAI